jgi:precorrin-2 methylase
MDQLQKPRARARRPFYDIAVLGWGTIGSRQLTLEQVEALSCARDIVLSPGVTPELRKYLGRLPAPTHDVGELYQEGATRRPIYERIAQHVLMLGETRGGTAFLQYGHPLVYSTPSQLILKGSARKKLKTLVYPGVSSIDQVLCVLGLDPADRGVTILNSVAVYQEKPELNPFVDLLLMVPGRLNDPTVSRTGTSLSEASRLAYAQLQAHLRTYYPAHHPLWAISVSAELSTADHVIKTRIDQLQALAPSLNASRLAS